MPVLNKMTEKGLIELGFSQTGDPLLNGTHLSQFLAHYGAVNPNRIKHGLYFIFYVGQEAFAPIYVGKGKIPGRILQHF